MHIEKLESENINQEIWQKTGKTNRCMASLLVAGDIRVVAEKKIGHTRGVRFVAGREIA